MTQAMPSPSSTQPVRSRRIVPFVIRLQLLTHSYASRRGGTSPKPWSVFGPRRPRDAHPHHKGACGRGEGQQTSFERHFLSGPRRGAV
jgi:hypothetical protein